MSADTDLIKLYSTRILALAADVPHLGRLQAPQGSARKRSPLCGSTVTADVTLRAGQIQDFAQDVKACALGQASAAVLGAVVLGLDRDTLARGHADLISLLKHDGPPPAAPFEELVVLTPARDFKNRHASILLPFEAALAAFAEAEMPAANG